MKYFSSCVLLSCLGFTASAERRVINVGDHRLSIDCDGARSQRAAVVLIAGQGRTARDWDKVQPAVAKFARVCSYDRAGIGESDGTSKAQSVAEIVEDLHVLLRSAGEKPPFVLVGHSIAGIYARRFVTTFPRDVAALVLVDSSHEEQAWRLHEVDPHGPALRKDLSDFFYVRRARGSNGKQKYR